MQNLKSNRLRYLSVLRDLCGASGAQRMSQQANVDQLTLWWGRDTLGFMQKGGLKTPYST